MGALKLPGATHMSLWAHRGSEKTSTSDLTMYYHKYKSLCQTLGAVLWRNIGNIATGWNLTL